MRAFTFSKNDRIAAHSQRGGSVDLLISNQINSKQKTDERMGATDASFMAHTHGSMLQASSLLIGVLRLEELLNEHFLIARTFIFS